MAMHGGKAMNTTPQETLEVRQARRLIAIEDECREWGHRLKMAYNQDNAEAVCDNGCGVVFQITFKYTKELT